MEKKKVSVSARKEDLDDLMSYISSSEKMSSKEVNSYKNNGKTTFSSIFRLCVDKGIDFSYKNGDNGDNVVSVILEDKIQPETIVTPTKEEIVTNQNAVPMPWEK